MELVEGGDFRFGEVGIVFIPEAIAVAESLELQSKAGGNERTDAGARQVVLRERVPIVPVVSRGTHEQFRVLARGDAFARLIRLHEWARAEVFPIVLSLPWGLTSGFVPYLPLPSPTTLAFGEPLAWPELDAAAANDPAVVRRCYEDVRARMQSLLDGLYADRGRQPAARAACASPAPHS